MNYNPFLPEVQVNPYPYYAYLRREAPVYFVEAANLWAVSRYDDVLYVLRNPALFSSTIMSAAMMGDLNPTPDAASMISSDPPVHTRLRKLVNRAFTPRLIAGLEPRLREIAVDLLQHIAPHGSCDLVYDVTIPLPVIVIAEMLGVETGRRADFKRWSNDIIAVTNGVVGEERERARQSITEFRLYFERVIEARRSSPRPDLISALVRAEEEEQMLSAEEILALTILLLVAGNETTTNLIGNAVLTLLAHPDILAQMQHDPSLIPAVIEETLRYDGPVQGIFRQATQDVTLSETTIPAGSLVLPLFASANHDERTFPDPDRFDVTRRNQSDHIAFGFGIHFCLGAPLARLEAKVVLEEMVARLTGWACPEESVPRVASFFLRGPQRLPLTFQARA